MKYAYKLLNYTEYQLFMVIWNVHRLIYSTMTERDLFKAHFVQEKWYTYQNLGTAAHFSGYDQHLG